MNWAWKCARHNECKMQAITHWVDLLIASGLGLIDLVDPTDRELLLEQVGDLSRQDEPPLADSLHGTVPGLQSN